MSIILGKRTFLALSDVRGFQVSSHPSTQKRTYLTATQVAEVIHMCPRTLANWRYRRMGPPWIKVGGRPLYEESALHSWLDAHTVEEIPRAAGL